jgi:hypothetical protein
MPQAVAHGRRTPKICQTPPLANSNILDCTLAQQAYRCAMEHIEIFQRLGVALAIGLLVGVE